MVRQDGITIVGARGITVERHEIKRARIAVDEDLRVRVTLPLDFSQEEIVDLIERKEQWIQKQLAFFRDRRDARIKLSHDEILYLGEIYTFQHLPGLRSRVAIKDEGKIIYSGRNLLADGALDRWYRKEAKRVIMERLEHFAKTYNFTYNKVFVRNQKTLWGSCSSKRNLSFNWRLIQTPLDIIDYIVVHELVHTKILQHTKAYWERVASLYPQYRQARVWLKNFYPIH
ncbi:MAG: SprT family zinc-dependent metalloprotease [Deltaproteobacteria bacterium]